MSIIEKLNLKKYPRLTVLNEPESYTIFDSYPNELSDEQDCIFSFVYTLDEMKELAFDLIQKDVITTNGYLFFAYPKMNNKVYETYIHRDAILPGLETDDDGFVKDSLYKFSRMVALDEVFTVVGIKKMKKRA